MNWTALGLGAVTLLAIGSSTPVGAQELERGTWTGTMSPPGAEAIPVTYEVGGTDSALSIVMSSPGVMGEVAFSDVRVTSGELTFWWEPGVRLDCRLLRTQDGGFEGICTDGSGANGEGLFKMVPPTGEDRL